MTTDILVAGIGNIFFGDDAFGVEVARRLAQLPQPEGVRVVDFGIRGIDLAFAMLDPHDAVILVDAMRWGQPPGTLRVIEPDLSGADVAGASGTIETHEMIPSQVLRAVGDLGGPPVKVLLVGCEPATIGSHEEPIMGLSAAVQDAVERAIPLVQELVADLLGECRSSGEERA